MRYQIHLKSISGPIDVVLLNKHSVSSDPVVLPVPPPEEILQNAKLAMSSSYETESSAAQCPASADTTSSSKSKWTSIDDVKPSFLKTEPHRAGASKCEYFSLCNF